MPDARAKRKAKVVPFLSKLDKDRVVNFQALMNRAKMLKMEGFENVNWEESSWLVTGGYLTKQAGRKAGNVTLNFLYSPKLGGEAIESGWAALAKALLVLRFHRRNQATSNQRNFIIAVGYVAHEAMKRNHGITKLTPEYLDAACRLMASHYSEGVAYNLHKAIGEFAAHCDANKLCKVHLQYKYARMKRPENTAGVGHKRLDDPEVVETKSDKMVAPKVFRVFGELYQKLPKDHKYRFYVLIFTLLACLGRRFSEIVLLPDQRLQRDDAGRAYIEYFPRKASQGDVYTPKLKLYLATEVSDIVEAVIDELAELCSSARETANIMFQTQGPDFSFLNHISEDQRIYKDDLKSLGLNPQLLNKSSWIRENGYTIEDPEKLTKQGIKSHHPPHYTIKAGLKAYCQKDFIPELNDPIHIDGQGNKYYLKDLLLVRYIGLSSGAYSQWVATQCTHSMMTSFMRKFAGLVKNYVSINIEVDFTSHHFRHTLNTLLDEGGLSDLLQTEWFGRTNPRDTKAYQHTSREKRALMLRADIKQGLVGGKVAEQIINMPVEVQDSFLKARINAVHDVGTGLCVHNFAQMPCERHLQCSAECKDYVWVKGDKGRLEELKRQYSLTAIALDTAEKKTNDKKPKKSVDWIIHNEKKLKVLSQQLKDNNMTDIDPYKYLAELTDG